MFCPHCGADNPESALHCQSCGKPTRTAAQAGNSGTSQTVVIQSPGGYGAAGGVNPAAQVKVPWILTIVSLLCCGGSCCYIPGIIALIFCIMANSAMSAGDIAGAQAKAGTAKMAAWTGIILGLVMTIIFVVLQIVFGVLAPIMAAISQNN